LKIDQGKLLHSVLYSIENMTFVNTLRIALRSGGKLSETDWQFFAQFLPDTEIIELKSARNVATQLLQKQGKVLGALIGKDWGEQQVLLVRWPEALEVRTHDVKTVITFS